MEIKNFRAIHDKERLEEMIAEGEHESQDFKFCISDSRKIARSIAAFANHSGGRLLVGVKDNGNIAGIRSDEEFYMIEQAADMYCRPSQSVKQTIYCADGKYVLVVDIKPTAARPVLAQDDNRNWRVYYRINDENIVAPDILTRIWRESKHKGCMLKYSDTEASVLRYVEEHEVCSLEEIMIACHLSKKRVEDITVFLCSISLLELKYQKGEWLFAVKEQEAL